MATIAMMATGSAPQTLAQSDAPPSVAFGEPGALAAGNYHGPLGSTQWTVTVPDGWEWFYDILWADLDGRADYQHLGGPGEVALGWWQVEDVFADPCHWKGSLPDPPVGPSVEELAAAFSHQVGRGGSEPIDVVLGGYPARMLELSTPSDLEIATCDDGVYREFLGPGESPTAAPGPEGTPNVGDRLDVLYILDVDGTRSVLRTWHNPDASGQDLAELEAMLGSIVIGAAAEASAAPPRAAIGQAADDGARIVQVDVLDARTRDLTIESPSVGTVQVRLLLPAGFEADGTADWPVLYLLHGYGQGYVSWTYRTDVEALTEPTDLLVVMPEADSGWYSDAWNDGDGGPPAWETFHTIELLQLLERNWGAGKDRVVAGLSMGGLGAMDYAARHPGLFKAAASYSGVLDTSGSDMDGGKGVFGDPIAQADVWTAHNPVELASALEGVALYVSYGDGQPGPLDPVGTLPSDIELWVAPQNEAFVARLEELGIPVTVDAYGPGTHEWPYWERALHRSLPMLLAALDE